MANENNKLIRLKTIKIPFIGHIGILGCSGPVEVPFQLEIEKIGEIIAARYPVVEVLKDGTEVKLDMANYDKENGMGLNASIIITNRRTNKKKQIDRSVKDFTDEVSPNKRLENILLASTKKPNPKFTEDKVVDKVPAEKIEVHKDGKKGKFQEEKFDKK